MPFQAIDELERKIRDLNCANTDKVNELIQQLSQKEGELTAAKKKIESLASEVPHAILENDSSRADILALMMLIF